MKKTTEIFVKETLPIIGGAVLTLSGLTILGRGLISYGAGKEISELAHEVFEEGKVDYTLYDRTGRNYCVEMEYLGD